MVMWWSCDGHVMVMCWSCDGHVMVMCWSCDGHVMVMWGSCDGHVRVMWWSCEGHVLVMWWSCDGYVMVMWWSCVGHVTATIAAYRWCTEAVHSHDGHLPPVYRQPLSRTWGKCLRAVLGGYIDQLGLPGVDFLLAINEETLMDCVFAPSNQHIVYTTTNWNWAAMGAPYTNWHICACFVKTSTRKWFY